MSKAKKQNDIGQYYTPEFLEQILAIAPGHIYWKNLKGEFLGCNTLQAIDAGFLCQEDMIGLTDYDMPWKEYADFLRSVDAQVVTSGKQIVTEEKSKTFSGREAIWLSTKEPLRNKAGEIIGIIGTSIDITDRKETERLRIEKNWHLESVLAVAPGHVYWKNLKGEYQLCNALQASDVGLKNRDDIIGLTDYDLPWKEDADFIRSMDALVIAGGKPVIVEEKAKTFDGREAIWLSTKEPLRNESGEIIGIIGTSVDITSHKEAERLKAEIEKHEALERQNKLFEDFTNELLALINSFQISNDGGQLTPQILDTDFNIKLTKRETEVLYFLSRTKKPKDIAVRLNISPKTVQSIIDTKLFPKLNTYNVSDLIEKARILKLIPLKV